MLTLLINTDNSVRWDEMDLATTGVDVNNATVTFALKDAIGTTVASGTLGYVAASAGRYEGVIPSTTVLIFCATYWLELTAVSGSADSFRRIECVAKYQDDS